MQGNELELEPVSEGHKVRRSGYFSQFMVFINGFILTIAAFVVLLVFIGEMREDAVTLSGKGFVTNIHDQFTKISLSVNTLANYYKISPFTNDKAYIPNNDLFNRILVAYKTIQGHWTVKEIYTNDSYKAVYTSTQLFQDLAPILAEKEKQNILQSLFTSKHEFVDPETHESRFFFYAASTIRENDQNVGYVIAMVNTDALVTAFSIPSTMANIARYRIYDKATGRPVMHSSRIHDPQMLHDVRVQQVNQETHLDSGSFEVILDIVEDQYLTFIAKLPFLLLLFGGTLTIVGTLYVRNNQKQAYQLSMLNDVLADKNGALQKMVEETRNLYGALKQGEHKYRSVINAVQDILFELDVNGRIVFLNNAWEKVTGLPQDDVIGNSFFNFLNDRDVEEIRSNFNQLLNGDKASYRGHILLKVQFGEYRSTRISLSVLNEGKENNIKIIGTLTDIEDKKQAEHALKEVEKRYRAIVENAQGGIYQIALDGTLISANPAFAHILGFATVEDLKAHMPDIRVAYVSPSDRKIYEDELIRNGFVRNHEAQMRQYDGSSVWVNENARVVKDNNGKILYFEGSSEDITARKQVETEMIEAKLASDIANRAKSEFLANMSHELRTPLNAIIGFSEIIKGEALGEIQQKVYVDYAKDIYDSGSRLLSVINEILNISKIESGGRHLNESIVSLQTVSQTCIDLLATKIEKNKLEVYNKIDETAPDIVAEELAFKQIFMNLISNAIKFTPPGGRITVECECKDATSDLRISITDTGIGIDERDIPKAMSPFWQLDNAMSRSNNGTGLGLTLVDSLIRLHGGRLEMVSQKNVGTTVTLVVPARRVAIVNKNKNTDDTGVNDTSNITTLSHYQKR